MNDCELLNRFGMIFHVRESHVQEFPFPPLPSLTPSFPAAFLVVWDLLRFAVFQQWNLVSKSLSRSPGTYMFFHIFTCIFTMCGYITNSQHHNITSSHLLAQLCRAIQGFAVAMGLNPVQACFTHNWILFKPVSLLTGIIADLIVSCGLFSGDT